MHGVKPDIDSEAYVRAIQMVHELTNFKHLVDEVTPESLLYHSHRPGGSIVVAVRNDGVPEGYRYGIYGFRLAQSLRLRFADAQIAFRRALVSEPNDDHSNEIHVFAIDPETGGIIRYISLLGSPDPEPLSPLNPRRTRFPCEVAHGVNLFDYALFPADLDTSEIWEMKRLIQRRGEKTSSAQSRLRLTLELMLGFYTTLSRIQPEVRMLIGDGEEGIAIRRMLRSLRDVTVLEGTTPSLPADDLMFRLYTTRDVVKPFVAMAPRGEELHQLTETLADSLDNPNPLDALKGLVESVDGRLRRIRI